MTIFLSFLLSAAGCEKDGSGDRTGQPPTPETRRSDTGMSSTQGSEYAATGSVADPTRAGGERASGFGSPESPGAGPGASGTARSGSGTGMEEREAGAEEPRTGLEEASDYMDDSVITAKIKQDILSDPLLKAAQIDVETENGVVKLSGVVDSQQSIDRVKAIAQSVTDVKAVESELAIREGGSK
ncbi:BON domain-containing protein [Methylomicrobium agile]|nr:BON domain-containing protein [Methylomicrobium agile]